MIHTPQELLGNFSDPIFIIDRQAKIHWLNAAARNLLGIDKTQTPESLSAYLAPTCLNQILNCHGSTVVPLQLKSAAEQNQFLIALDSGVSDPDHDLIQVMAKPTFALPKRQEEFLAMLAHDLKNPLGALFGYADALIDTSIGDSLSPAQREVITRIRNTAARSLDLVRNFQYLASSNDSLGSPRGSSINLNSVVESVSQDIWRDDSGTAKLKLELTTPSPAVAVEKIALERLMANLLTNAQKFTPVNGQVLVRTTTDKDKAILEVNNTGPEIPASEIPRLFDRAFRGTNSSQTPGSGLGLFIVKSIVDGVKGKIAVTSDSKSGTTFRVTLPAGTRQS